MRRAAIVSYAGCGGVTGDDLTDGARGERLRGCAASVAQADEQRVAGLLAFLAEINERDDATLAADSEDIETVGRATES